MSFAGITTGSWGEDVACQFLQRRGLTIVARNVRTPLGEIDCIAQKGSELYFVEVKTRIGCDMGRAIEQIPWHKQRRLIRLAKYYLRIHDVMRLYPHISVVAIDGTRERHTVDFIPDAVECGA